MESLLEGTGHLSGFQHGGGPLGDGLGDGGDVHGLEVFLVQTRAGGLAGDAQDWDGVGAGRVQAGDHVGAGGAAGADTHTDVAGDGTGIAFSHVAGALDVTGQDVADATVVLHCCVQRVDSGTRYTECNGNAFFFEHANCGFNRFHLGHEVSFKLEPTLVKTPACRKPVADHKIYSIEE